MCPLPESAGQSGGVNISGGTVNTGGGDIFGGNKGLSVEELVAVLEARGTLQTAETAGLQRRVIVMLAQRLTPDVRDFDQAVRELERAVEVALELIERGERGADRDDFVNAVLARVAEKTRIGDLDGGASTIDQGLADLDAAHRRSRVALLEEGVKVDILRRDAVAVSRRIEMLVATDQPSERPTWLPAFRERYDAFYKDGEANGINFSLSVAIELARRMVAAAHCSTEYGNATNLLVAALCRLGERESGTEHPEEAVTACRAVLQESIRERVPLLWAETQSNLGRALLTLGRRESGTERLEEAVAAFREALEERTRERVPLDWAVTQNNLGIALATLGERESGTARLEEAVAAYRAALQERTRERVLLWAMTQNNLGAALAKLGERESGTARLEEAVTAFREALEELTRERVPLLWAETQNNLGKALEELGERESNAALLVEAVAACRAAPEELTRERVPPSQWAVVQTNLALALWTLGEVVKDPAMLRGAREAMQEAFDAVMPAGEEKARTYFESRLQELDGVIATLKPKIRYFP